MDNARFQQILAEYEKQRMKNHHILEQRRQQVYREIPAYQELEASIASYSVNQVRRLLADETDEAGTAAPSAAPDYKQAIRQKRGQLLQLLREHSFPSDFLDPIYTLSLIHI